MNHKAILVVDDEKEIRDAVKEALELYGYPTFTASDGNDAFSVLSQMARPGLIILDLMMPGMDGREFIKRKQISEVRDVPVVVISADKQAPQKTLDMGGDGYLRKPIEFNDLLKIAELYCD